MGLGEQVGGLYAGLEQRFYEVMDFLADKGIPVYSAIDPLEDRGIPSFPVALGAAALLFIAIFGMFFISNEPAQVKLSITDGQGASLTGVSVRAYDVLTGNEIALGSNIFTDGQIITIPGKQKGARMRLEASKEGYGPDSHTVIFSDALEEASLVLSKPLAPIAGILHLVDDETGSTIENAQITARFADASVDCTATENGTYECLGVQEGVDTQITVRQANYEQKTISTKFTGASVSEIELAAKPEARTGNANLILRAYDFETKQRIGNFNLKIYDARANELITDISETDNDGEQSEQIAKGTSVRIVAEKQGYISYDSSDVNENTTLRDDELIVDAYLRKGSTTLIATVLDATARPMQGMDVFLFNSDSEIISQKATNFSGQASFEGLNPRGKYFVSAWQEGFLPVSNQVELSKASTTALKMERGTAQNSGSLTIFTTDEKSAPLNGATLNIFVLGENGTEPFGTPAQKSDATGKLSLLAPLNKTVVVRASKDGLAGEGSAKILETFRNEIVVKLGVPTNGVLLKVVDGTQKEVNGGAVSVKAGDETLYEDTYETGGVRFDPGSNRYVDAAYVSDDGKAAEDQLYVADVNEVVLSTSAQNSRGATPTIEFEGIYSVDGEKIGGIPKGEDVYLKFKILYPASKNNYGLHVRIGDDSDAFSDSMDAGIVGFSAIGAAAFYSRTYSKEPSPGFESLDFQNSGSEGAYNKWAELYFTNGGEKNVKIRVKAKESATHPQIALHYRAWSKIAGKYYREPLDSELESDEYSERKTALYAQTKTEQLKIIGSSASCQNDLCASFRFIKDDGTEYDADNFKGELGSLYALDVLLAPIAAQQVTVKASTSKQKPKIGFQGFGIDNFNAFPDNASTDTSIEVTKVNVPADDGVDVRLYFKTLDVENSSITLQLVSGTTVINEQFNFNIYREKSFALRTSPENVAYGQDFTIILQDANGVAVENAQIKLMKPDGAHAQTLIGDASARRGQGGRYFFKNVFDSGALKYQITAPDFKRLDGSLEITKSGLIQWADAQSYISIQKSQKSAQKLVEISNLSKSPITNLIFEVKPIGTLPDGMSIKVTPLNALPANSTQKVTLTAEYTAGLDFAHGEARLIARGKTETGFGVISETKIVAEYNPKIPEDCVEFSKTKLVVFVASGAEDQTGNQSGFGRNSLSGVGSGSSVVNPNFVSNTAENETQTSARPYSQDPYAFNYAGSYGANYAQYSNPYYSNYNFGSRTSESFTVQLANKPECQVPLELAPQVVRQSATSTGIDAESTAIKLLPAAHGSNAARSDQQNVTVYVTNSLARNYSGKQQFNFDIKYNGMNFSKSLPLEVYVWNPRYALDISRNIELYLGPNDKGVFATQIPIFVRNVGQADIENIEFRVSSSTSRGNVNLKVFPEYAVPVLRKGETISPPPLLIAEASRNEKTTIADVKVLEVSGVIDGRTFSFGPVNVVSHISAANCLTVSPQNISFVSLTTQGSLQQPITVSNSCAEEVRIIDITQPNIGDNELVFTPNNATLPPGSSGQFTLVLNKRSAYSGGITSVFLQAFLPRSGTPINSSPILADIKIGTDFVKGTAATEKITVDICEGGTREIQFPIIATGGAPQCDTAYCDAQQLSKFIADRIEAKIKDAEKQVQNTGGEVQKSSCSNQIELAQGYCSFASLGLKSDDFFAYFSNDNLSLGAMRKAIETRNSSIKNFRVEFLPNVNGGQASGGYSRQIYLTDNIQGCGRYHIALEGSVAVQGTRIVPELMNVTVNVRDDDGAFSKTVTDQCSARIQNIMNFLPKDDAFTVNQRSETWLGVVQPLDSTALGPLATEISKSIFSSDKRVVTSNIGANTLQLNVANTEGALVKIEVDKVQTTGPVTVRALVRNTLDNSGVLQKDVARDAGNAIAALRNNEFSGCFGTDESYALLKSPEGTGELRVEAKDKLTVSFDAITCVEINVSSRTNETAQLFARTATSFDGLSRKPFFIASSGKPTIDSSAQTPPTGQGAAPIQDATPSNAAQNQRNVKLDYTKEITELALTNLDEKTNTYKGAAYLCVKGDSQFVQSQGKQIIVEARRRVAQSKKPASRVVELQINGIHPIEFLQKSRTDAMKATKSGEYYYATFVWKGGPNEMISLTDLARLAEVTERVDKARAILDDKRPIQKEDSGEVVSAKTSAATSYLIACSSTSLLTSLLRPTSATGFGYLINVLGDCGIPYMHLMAGIGGTLGNIFKPIDDALQQILTAPLGVISWIGKTLGIGGDSIKQAQAELIDQSAHSDTFNVFEAYGLTLAWRELALQPLGFGPRRTDVLEVTNLSKIGLSENLGKANYVAGNVVDNLLGEYAQKAFPGRIATPQVQAHLLTLRTKWIENIDESLADGLKARGKAVTEAELKDIIVKSAQKAGSDPGVITEFGRATSSLSSTGKDLANYEASKTTVLSDIEKIESDIVRKPELAQITATTTKDATVNAIEDTITNDLKRQAIAQYAAKTGISERDILRIIADNPALASRYRNIAATAVQRRLEAVVPRTGPPIIEYEWKVTKDSQDAAAKEIKNLFKDITTRAIENPQAIPQVGATSAQQSLEKLQQNMAKKISKPGLEKIATAITAETDVKSGVPKLFSREWLKALGFAGKNIFKDALTGVLANAVGLYFYDKKLTNTLKPGTNVQGLTREEELAAAGVDMLGQSFACEDNANTCILNYRTYRIDVKVGIDGKRSFKLKLVDSLPQNISQDKIIHGDISTALNETAGAMPGLIPVLEPSSKFPRIFRKNEEMQKLHVLIARNYLIEPQGGKRIGSEVSAALKNQADPQSDYQAIFRAQTNGMNLEALVVSIGIVKSKLGLDSGSVAIFGCSLGDGSVADTFGNAQCAARKLITYVPKCATAVNNKATCFLRSYESDTANLPSNQKAYARDMTLSDNDFQDLYDTWSSPDYVWGAP